MPSVTAAADLLMSERYCRICFVDSVLPAPLSPLPKHKIHELLTKKHQSDKLLYILIIRKKKVCIH